LLRIVGVVMNQRKPKFDWIKTVLADPLVGSGELAAETPLRSELSVDLKTGQLMINLDNPETAISLFVFHGSQCNFQQGTLVHKITA
jgi:hypothetical protein